MSYSLLVVSGFPKFKVYIAKPKHNLRCPSKKTNPSRASAKGLTFMNYILYILKLNIYIVLIIFQSKYALQQTQHCFFVASPKFQHCLNEKWGKSYIRDYKQIIYVQISTFWNISPAIGHPYRHRCPSRRKTKTCPGPFASRPRRHPLCQPKYQHLRTVSSEKGKPIPTDQTY